MLPFQGYFEFGIQHAHDLLVINASSAWPVQPSTYSWMAPGSQRPSARQAFMDGVGAGVATGDVFQNIAGH